MARTVDGDHTDKYIDNLKALDAYYREALEALDVELQAERKTGRVISVIDADSVLAGGGRVRYKDLGSGRRNSLLIHALQARFDRVLDATGEGAGV